MITSTDVNQRRHTVAAYMSMQRETEHLPRRLRRLERIECGAHPIFFVTTCIAGRRPLLANPAIHRLFVEFSKQSPTRAAVWVGR